MKIALFGQEYKTESLQYIVELVGILTKKECEIIIYKNVLELVKEQLSSSLETYTSYYDLPDDVTYMISVGGDGTMLRATKYIKDKNIPIIGINTGRMGFLANIHKDFMHEAINELLAENFSISERKLLAVNIHDSSIDKTYYALNEITVSRKNTASMITIDASLNSEHLNTYWADGLIVATPTGSTGYSLSCNGPIVTPDVSAFTITPIAPHNLSIRPLIINDNNIIKLQVSSREENYLLSLDSKVIDVKTGVSILIKKADFTIKMLILNNQSFLKTLREKLLWGKDTRN